MSAKMIGELGEYTLQGSNCFLRSPGQVICRACAVEVPVLPSIRRRAETQCLLYQFNGLLSPPYITQHLSQPRIATTHVRFKGDDALHLSAGLVILLLPQ